MKSTSEKLNFEFYDLHCLKDMERGQKRDWGYRYPSLKIVFGGILEVGSASHLNQHVKITPGKLNSGFITCIVLKDTEEGKKGLGTGTSVLKIDSWGRF